MSPETGRRSRGRALSDERSKELARQDERQPDSRSPRLAAKPVHHRIAVKIDALEKHIVFPVILSIFNAKKQGLLRKPVPPGR